MHMKTRCNPGDLAVITRDVSSCAQNIGRVVAVSGPMELDPCGHVTWLIQPATPEPYMINDHSGRFVRYMDPGETGIEHRDDWMMPFRPGKPDENVGEQENRVTNKEVVSCR
jgi:hypothetical protein